MGVVAAPAHELVHGLAHDRVRWLEAPAGAFLADPMTLTDGEAGGTLLAELYWHRERRGKIVALDVNAPEPVVVLERAWHLSYPFLFEHEGQTYCLPEMWEARRVQLFRAEPFPSRWIDGPILLDDFAGVDATLHHDGERFWLFCADRDDSPEAKLWLFHSRDLERGWQPHPWNPIRCDLRGSRPAGPLFTDGATLWRPAQDCTTTYGGAVVINRVLELTPTRYREEAVTRLEPDRAGPYPDGLHTFCAAGPMTLIDGKRHFVAPSGLLSLATVMWRGLRRARPRKTTRG